MITTNVRSHRGAGLSTMAYFLMFAAGTFCVIIGTFAVLARHPVQTETGQPEQPATLNNPADHS